MSIPNLIKGILAIHDLNVKVQEQAKQIEELQQEVKDLQSTQNDMEQDFKEIDDKIEQAIENADLSNEVSAAIEGLNISIQVHK